MKVKMQHAWIRNHHKTLVNRAIFPYSDKDIPSATSDLIAELIEGEWLLIQKLRFIVMNISNCI